MKNVALPTTCTRGTLEVSLVITAAKLKSRTAKDLAAMAKKKAIPGWHSMRKDELIQALARRARADAAKKARRAVKGTAKKPAAKKTRADAAEKPRSRRTERRLSQIKAKLTRSRDLTYRSSVNGNGYSKDRLVLMVRDAYWLHAYWELTRQSVERARVALGQHWHASRPVLRLYEVTSESTTSTVRKIVRDIEIHGGVNNWYVDINDPPKSFQLDIGYLTAENRFLSLTRSNVVTTPQSGSQDLMDGNWQGVAEDFDRIYALSGGYDDRGDTTDLKDLFEERLRRPMGSPMVTRFGRGAQATGRNRREFPFDVDAELIVYGVTSPNAHVTLKGEPVRLQPDGTFSVRFNLPERRQVLPVVASTGDGTEQRTIILAVERNTKVMEPVFREPDA